MPRGSAPLHQPSESSRLRTTSTRSLRTPCGRTGDAGAVQEEDEPQPDAAPAVFPRLYLLDCSELEDKIKSAWSRFYESLCKGREQDIHLSYLASHRAPST